jgi:hypothetical protein
MNKPLLAILVLTLALGGCANFNPEVFDGILDQSLDSETVAAGLKEALEVGTQRDTAATDYFRRQTSAELEARFQPIVTEKMEEVGVYRLYDELANVYNLLPVSKPKAIDLDDYITDRTTNGIFLMLEKEETKIRKDPASRTTELLRKVFE